MPQVSLTVNGKPHIVEIEGRTLLVELLREKLGLTGTHVGCDNQPMRRVRRAHQRLQREILHHARRTG